MYLPQTKTVVGSENGTFTAFTCKKGWKVTRGCFIGTKKEFLEASKEKHGENTKINKEYKLLIKLAESRFKN